jgi:hypothetical protein
VKKSRKPTKDMEKSSYYAIKVRRDNLTCALVWKYNAVVTVPDCDHAGRRKVTRVTSRNFEKDINNYHQIQLSEMQ